MLPCCSSGAQVWQTAKCLQPPARPTWRQGLLGGPGWWVWVSAGQSWVLFSSCPGGKQAVSYIGRGLFDAIPWGV